MKSPNSSSNSPKNHAAIIRMITSTLPRNTPPPFEMAPGTLRWEINRSQLPDLMGKIEKALQDSEHVQGFTVEQGQISANQLFIQVVYSRANE
ncbi:MAG: hypothetical protein V4671_11615 [Armatimonadota bacterium]